MGQETIGDAIRNWRKQRKISQLDLALEVGVSAKHISFVETGRCGISRKLILTIANALSLSSGETGRLLRLSGFSAQHAHPTLSVREDAAIKGVLQTLLDKHDPFPAAAIDASYRIVNHNTAFAKLVAFFLGPEALKGFDNLLVLTFSPQGLRPYFPEADTLQAFMARRIEKEPHLREEPAIAKIFFENKATASIPSPPEVPDSDLPVVSFRMQKDDVTLRFFSVITTFGAPTDMKAGEFRIETLYPGDEITEIRIKTFSEPVFS